ncbi:MAG: transposase [Pirellulales bacterium]
MIATCQGLQVASPANLQCPPIHLAQLQAEQLLRQFQETARLRQWSLFAVAIMANHCHIVAGVPGDPDPSKLLGDFKSYGSRSLNRRWSKPASGTWWTESGSKRKLPSEESVLAAVRYVLGQEYPLVLWTACIPELDLPGGQVDPNGERPGERGA